jgi:lipopolysaccharide transport system ATP-binding protein
MSVVIKVEHLSKKYIIGHEEKEKYTALRDVMSRKAKKIFSVGLSKQRNRFTTEDFWAINDLSFCINQGDRIGIIGRNGAGKSTLLKLLSRITEPSSGRITIKGRVASLLEVGTGFHPELSGRENIYLNGAILGMSRAEIKKKFDEIVSFAEVEQFLDTPVKRYSSGMYVRLAFAVAAHLEPEILIVDEVLAVGDAQFQKKCLGKMEDVSKNLGRTVLFVSHNMGVVAQLCNNAILLKKGEIEAQGTVGEVVEKYISNGSNVDQVYLADKDVAATKDNYFTKVFTSNELNEVVSDFSFNESICLNFEFTINEMAPNLLVGIGIQDKLQNRVSTILKPVSFFNYKEGNKYHGSVKLPSGVFAPNLYSFLFVIWIKDVKIYDSVENVCPVKIHDSGTEHAVYEGLDYGSIIIQPKWQND